MMAEQFEEFNKPLVRIDAESAELANAREVVRSLTERLHALTVERGRLDSENYLLRFAKGDLEKLKVACQPFVAYAKLVHPGADAANRIGVNCPSAKGSQTTEAKPWPTIGDCRALAAILETAV